MLNYWQHFLAETRVLELKKKSPCNCHSEQGEELADQYIKMEVYHIHYISMASVNTDALLVTAPVTDRTCLGLPVLQSIKLYIYIYIYTRNDSSIIPVQCLTNNKCPCYYLWSLFSWQMETESNQASRVSLPELASKTWHAVSLFPVVLG